MVFIRRKHSFMEIFFTRILVSTLVCLHTNKSVAEHTRIEKETSEHISIVADLTNLSYRYCLIWTSTRDHILENATIPGNIGTVCNSMLNKSPLIFYC